MTFPHLRCVGPPHPIHMAAVIIYRGRLWGHRAVSPGANFPCAEWQRSHYAKITSTTWDLQTTAQAPAWHSKQSRAPLALSAYVFISPRRGPCACSCIYICYLGKNMLLKHKYNSGILHSSQQTFIPAGEAGVKVVQSSQNTQYVCNVSLLLPAMTSGQILPNLRLESCTFVVISTKQLVLIYIKFS